MAAIFPKVTELWKTNAINYLLGNVTLLVYSVMKVRSVTCDRQDSSFKRVFYL